jgi:hypothetical protein
MNIFTQHPNETANPEGFWKHFHRSFTNGFVLIGAGIVAIIHAFCPFWWKFYTAETVIRLYWTHIHTSGRHDDLINKWKQKGPRDE